ncbi:hypothetical protein ACHAXA_007858 [Cyclostephanos tholiformis]|uniref:Phytanoyl-CoA dioxygenase n=1 Tax=Cyclostephanos tholiformis TaxID=382380 RepID=A0ABD3R808_9STRA
MPRSSSSAKSAANGSSSTASKNKPAAAAAAAAAAAMSKKKPPTKKPPAAAKPAPKSKVISHTDDGTPIVNATLAQIRRGLAGKSSHQLVRIPQNAERSKFYAEAARAIGERESLALPYHGGRMWRCVVRVSDENGASGDNREANDKRPGGDDPDDFAECDDDGEQRKKKRVKTNYHSHTPLFRWYRGGLVLATLPYILDDIVEVRNKQSGKKRWANGLSDDELDSSDEEWDDGRYVVEPITKVTMEASALTTSAYEDTCHPMPRVGRVWISPDLRRFTSRKSAIAHAEELVGRDLLVDRVMYGYGCHGARLRPVKPTRKVALEAGMVRFLRDGLWVVGQEEMWIERRRDILVKKQEKRLLLTKEVEGEGSALSSAAREVGVGESERDVCKDDNDSEVDSSAIATNNADEISAAAVCPITVSDTALSRIAAASRTDAVRAAEAAADVAASAEPETAEETSVDEISAAAVTAAAVPAVGATEFAQTDSTGDSMLVPQNSNGSCVSSDDATAIHSSIDNSKPVWHADTKIVSPEESDASTEGAPKSCDPALQKDARRVLGTRPPPEFVPSVHYRLNQDQIARCFAACVDHYEKVMHTVKARSLYHELADGFDVFRERGRGRYDMELALFDTEEFSFLTDRRKAAWMPIVHKILGDDALLVHKGCFISLPGAESQVYHQDGVHLNQKTHKPCYAINVFIPLVDYNNLNGPTEFCLGSHYLGHENFVKENAYVPCVKAGTPVIFDYRLGHRGLRNISEGVRPVVYLTYSSVASGKEFRDSVNFSRKRYHKLGDFVEKPLSRGERLQKRRSEEKSVSLSKKDNVSTVPPPITGIAMAENQVVDG